MLSALHRQDDFGKLEMYAKQLTEAERVEEEIKEINEKEMFLTF